MKVIMVMFDSLNRHMLPPYGCDWTHAPNFQRLAERTLTFDTSYVCSMPCMPARRDLHTGRPNFLHRSWGPLEPFDDSTPRMLRDSGVSSHLISDHYHYWEAGGATYHTQYNTWQFFRGQEGDPWIGQVADPPPVEAHASNAGRGMWHRQDRVNRQYMRREEDQPQTQTFKAGVEFIRRNHAEDDWFLQIETFDPHEPFFTQRQYQDLYPELFKNRSSVLFDWPTYGQVTEEQALVDQCRGHYASLLSMCDARLGDILDEMDRLELWDDTMLIVWTDHGFLLSEHDLWAKIQMPWYQRVVQHAVLRLGSSLRPSRPAAAEPGATVDRLGADLAGPLWGGADRGHARPEPTRRLCERLTRARGRDFRQPRRAGQRHRWPLRVHACARPARQPAPVQLHAHAHAHA